MADTELADLTNLALPTKDDLVYVVNDPSGTPTNNKATLENLLKVIIDLTADSSPTIDDLVAVINDPAGTPGSRKVTIENLRNIVLSSSYINLQDQKAQNTGGGTFTLGAWRTRTLNTEVSDVGGLCTLASNQFTLSAGTYRIFSSAPGYRVARHQTRLQNITAGTTLLIGTCEYCGTGADYASTRSIITGTFTVAAAQALEIQHQSESTNATLGFGVPSNFNTEVYTVVELWKIG